MTGTHTAIALIAIATGVVVGFVVWTYVGPMLTSATAGTPTA